MLLDGTDTKGTERKKEIINEHIVFIDGFKVYRNNRQKLEMVNEMIIFFVERGRGEFATASRER